MPRTTHTYAVGDERDRVDVRLDELADQVARAGAGSGAYDDAVEEASTLEEHLVALEWLVDEYGADAEVTIGGLTTGEYAEATDRVVDAQSTQVGGPDSSTGVGRVFFVASGLVDAPFLDATDIESKADVVSGLPPQVTTWLEAEIDEATLPADPGNSFAERVQARSTSETNSEPPEQR